MARKFRGLKALAPFPADLSPRAWDNPYPEEDENAGARPITRPRRPINRGRFIHVHSIWFRHRPRRDLRTAIVVERAGDYAPGRRGAHGSRDRRGRARSMR